MTINDIVLFVKDRAGESNVEYLLREIKYVITRIWTETDYPGSLQTMTVQPSTDRFLILPYYVAELRGVRKAASGEVTLYTSAQAAKDNSSFLWPLEWRDMGKTPLLRSYDNVGKLTVKLRAPADKVFTVNLVGTGDFGVRVNEEVEFAVGDVSHVTNETFKDVIMFGKNVAITRSDVSLYDITDQLIAVLPSDRDIVQNIKVQIADTCAAPLIETPCNRYTILYKMLAPTFRSVNDVVEDQLGDIVRNLVVAGVLSKSGDTSAMNRMRYHGNHGTTVLNARIIEQNAGKQIRVDLARDPFTHEFNGYL